jgi:KTSC domain-containing protein
MPTAPYPFRRCNVERIPVESSSVKSIGYDSITKTLEVEFGSGGVYRYAPVPPEKYTAMLASESKGKYFQTFIRAQYEHTKL